MELENKIERLISYYMIERFEIVCFKLWKLRKELD